MTQISRKDLLLLARALRRLPRNLLHDIETRGLRPQEFTAILPLRSRIDHVRQRTELREALQAFANGKLELPGVHSARWFLLDENAADGGALVFTFVCDGWPLDVLGALAERHDPGLDNILRHCDGYPSTPTAAQCVEYLRSRRVRSSHLYHDARQRDPSAPELFATSREIQRALDLRRRFVELVANVQNLPPAKLQQQFRVFQGRRLNVSPQEASSAPGYPFEASPFERMLDNEGLWVRRTAEIVRNRARRDVRARAAASSHPKGLRGVHAKHHGLLAATVKVQHELPARLTAGVFQPGREYDAWIRLSSTSPTPGPDYQPDGRGFALKLLDVEGAPALPFAISEWTSNEPAARPTQDFLMVNHPTFFVKDARDYTLLRSLLDTNPDGAAERRAITRSALLFAARRPRELWTFVRTLLKFYANPLAAEYHSMIPVLLGQDPVKISVRPTEVTRRVLAGEPVRARVSCFLKDPCNYLRHALQRSLDLLGASTLEFELAAHVPFEHVPPVEDPRVDWGRCGAQRVVLATISVAAQDATSVDQRARAESMVFNPWHALAEHRTLGSLSRARLYAYLASAEERKQARRGPSDSYEDARFLSLHPSGGDLQ